MASQKQIVGARSRAGSTASTPRSGRASLRQPSVSGGVVGLPGTGDSTLLDDVVDPSLWEGNNAFFDEFFSQNAFDMNGNNTIDPFTNNYDANQFQNVDLSFFEQYGQNGLGLKLPFPREEQQHQPEQVAFSYGQQAEPTHNQLDLVQVNPTINPTFELTHNHSDFGAWGNNYTTHAQPSGTTPGLFAIPSGTSNPPPPVYPDPFDANFAAGPYFDPPVQQYTGYMTSDPQGQQQQSNISGQITHVDRTEPRRSSHTDRLASAKPKRKHVLSDSDTDDEVPLARHRRRVRPLKRSPVPPSDNSRHNSIVSDSSSLARPIKVTVARAGEKPKKCEEKSWVRINTTTKGETTRTARINQFTDEGPKYKVKPLPFGDWESGKFKFEYTHHNDMDEFKKRTMSARQIHEYISEHPGDLRIWIQVTPGDSARRYASKSHSECLFEQCPNRQWANKGTIEVGNYRVAFDEKHKTYGKGVVDPFDCVAYAHLYCMERFLDFEGICQFADVKVDTRGEMSKEPKGEAAFTFSGKHLSEKAIAEKFIKAAKVGQLGRTPEFSNYPIHTDYKKGEPKPHEQTLVAAMFNVNWEHRTRSQLKQFVYRNIKPGSFGIHRGDQEIIMVDKKVETLKAFKKAKAAKRHKNFDFSAYYDEFHPEINVRIAECLALRAQFKAEDVAGTAPARGGSKKRQTVIIDDSEDEEPDFRHDDDDFEEIGADVRQQKRLGFSQGSRSSPRKKQRINYAEPEDVPKHRNVYDQVAHHVANYEVASPNARKSSCSQLFLPKDQARYDIDNAPVDVSDLRPITDEELEALLSLPRRKSSTMSIGPYMSIMKSPKLDRIPHSPQFTRYSTRTASFNAQPVTSSKEYNINDPPSQVGVSPDAIRAVYDHLQQGRRSARLAGKTTPSLDKVETGRVGKRRPN
ncbi:Nn.00g006710.m01.CDS01 [Neocucurbitaria sp. VM-36]